ncbi:MAG: NAD(+)/NADH kinase [Nitrosomonas sp.]|nr:NAD(+)/NADH kinase [Nitrosomonas sp.]
MQQSNHVNPDPFNKVLIKIPSPQNILIFYNPISSAGNTEKTAKHLETELKAHGKYVQVYPSEKKTKNYKSLKNEITACDLVIIVGGDGTVRKLLAVMDKTGTPVYVIPGGNESLFANTYSMSTNSNDLLQAISQGNCLKQYYGLISGTDIRGKKPFFNMASMGLDSLTVKNIGKRKGPLNDSIYVWHGLKALCSLHHPTVSIRINDKTIIDRQSGYIIVANSSAYAKNLQLVPNANPSKPELVAGFLPGAKHQHELIKAIKILQRKPANLPMQYFSGKMIACTVHEESYPLQVDGDYFRNRDIQSESTVEFNISPSPIQVLIPSAFNNHPPTGNLR